MEKNYEVYADSKGVAVVYDDDKPSKNMLNAIKLAKKVSRAEASRFYMRWYSLFKGKSPKEVSKVLSTIDSLEVQMKSNQWLKSVQENGMPEMGAANVPCDVQEFLNSQRHLLEQSNENSNG